MDMDTWTHGQHGHGHGHGHGTWTWTWTWTWVTWAQRVCRCTCAAARLFASTLAASSSRSAGGPPSVSTTREAPSAAAYRPTAPVPLPSSSTASPGSSCPLSHSQSTGALAQTRLSKARLKRVSSRPAWSLLVWGSSPAWHTRPRRHRRSRASPAGAADPWAAAAARRWSWRRGQSSRGRAQRRARRRALLAAAACGEGGRETARGFKLATSSRKSCCSKPASRPPRRLTLPSERVAYSPVLLNPAGFEPRIPPVCNSGPVCRL